MDLLAALALVLIIEGVAMAIFARSLPELMAAMAEFGPGELQRIGLICIGLGVIGYLSVRGLFTG